MPPSDRLNPHPNDPCREQLQRRGVPYFADVQAQVARRLSRLSNDARTAFAAACAERLMQRHEALPKGQQRPFTLGWRPVLNAIWEGLERGDEGSRRRVREALDAFRAGPYNHHDGQDGPDDADKDAAAASLYAAESFVGGEPRAAEWAAVRAIEAAFEIAGAELEDARGGVVAEAERDLLAETREAMHPAVQGELGRQVRDLDGLERDGGMGAVLRALKAGGERMVVGD